MNPAGLLDTSVVSLAFIAAPAALVLGYRRARAEKPPFPVNRMTVLWATLVAFSLLVLTPAIAAGPAAGRETCATEGPWYPDCVLWSALSVLWPLLIPNALYLIFHAAVVFAPRALRRRFDRFDRWLERELRRAEDS